MSQNAYQILGISENATPQEVDQAYYALRDQYREQMYMEGAEGKNAARKLSEIEAAYNDITRQQAARPIVGGSEDVEATAVDSSADKGEFGTVAAWIKQGNLKDAQKALDAIGTRDAQWHFYQSNIYYKKGWMTEARSQLQMACDMDPTNSRYSTALSKMDAKLAEGTTNKGYNPATQGGGGSSNNNDGYNRSYDPNRERAQEDSFCRWCETCLCINCLCNSCNCAGCC